MSVNQHQLPCPKCDNAIIVTTRQAGQAVTCSECNETSVAPSLGALKRLPAVGGVSKPEQGGASTRSGAGNALFVFGLLLATLGILGGGGLYYYGNQQIVDYNVDGAMDRLEPYVDELTGSQIAVLFDQMNVDRGLGEWEEQPHVAQTKQAYILIYFSYALMAVGGVGLMLMVLGLSKK